MSEENTTALLAEPQSATFSSDEPSKLLTLGSGEGSFGSRRRDCKSLSARITSLAHDFSRVMNGAHLDAPTTFTNVDDILGLIFEFAGEEPCRRRLQLVNHQWRGAVLDSQLVQMAMESRVNHYNSQIDAAARPLHQFYRFNAAVTILTFVCLYPLLFFVFLGRESAEKRGNYNGLVTGYVLSIVLTCIEFLVVLLFVAAFMCVLCSTYKGPRWRQLILHILRICFLFGAMIAGATFISQHIVLSTYLRGPPIVAECPRLYNMSSPTSVKFVDPGPRWILSNVSTVSTPRAWFSYRIATYTGRLYPEECGPMWAGKAIPSRTYAGDVWKQNIQMGINFALDNRITFLNMTPNTTVQGATDLFWVDNDGVGGFAAGLWIILNDWATLRIPLLTSLEVDPDEKRKLALWVGYVLPPVVFWFVPGLQALWWVGWSVRNRLRKQSVPRGMQSSEVQHLLPAVPCTPRETGGEINA